MAHRGTSLVVAGEAQPPAVHALAHAMNQALGNIGATGQLSAAGRRSCRRDQHAALRELVSDMNAGRVQMLVDHRRVESRADGAGRSELRRRDEQGADAVSLRAVPRRDRDALSLARAGGALPRSVERRAHGGRHGDDRAAADSADVRRQVGARSGADAARSARSAAATTSCASTGWSSRRRRLQVHAGATWCSRCTWCNGCATARSRRPRDRRDRPACDRRRPHRRQPSPRWRCAPPPPPPTPEQRAAATFETQLAALAA